jgi:hypothetical protein
MASVRGLVAMADRLDHERIHLIAEAFRGAGRPTPHGARIAASMAGRGSEAFEARKEVAVAAMVFGVVHLCNEDDLRLASQAAGNAGIALATEDLIGHYGYTMREYTALITPWFAGFADLPLDGWEQHEH